jgi:hypothetical protein
MTWVGFVCRQPILLEQVCNALDALTREAHGAGDLRHRRRGIRDHF